MKFGLFWVDTGVLVGNCGQTLRKNKNSENKILMFKSCFINLFFFCLGVKFLDLDLLASTS